ncbi:oligosaccharide flippase family protein [Fulvivirga sediminis]|uniref:Oligosaccharide flippase family protein n=1 Tax=Fulvivirga sediminis TaxID=2803949 RepID=A0A937FAX2_9BACT|nr:oligosaccharide flippase family protein [Fulvivirga sediminis]MBL3658880.1 oligosaccharide flippase family protein [Fulvivirga sediminis]
MVTKNQHQLPKVSWLFVILAIGLIISCAQYIVPYIANNILGVASYGQYNAQLEILKYATIIIHFIFNIFISIWLINAAKSDKSKVLWFFFGLVFGILAIILFYLHLLINQMRDLQASLERLNLPEQGRFKKDPE